MRILMGYWLKHIFNLHDNKIGGCLTRRLVDPGLSTSPNILCVITQQIHICNNIICNFSSIDNRNLHKISMSKIFYLNLGIYIR